MAATVLCEVVDIGRARRLLELDGDVDAGQLRAAFRQLIRRMHPDVAPAGDEDATGNLATLATSELIVAYRFLQRHLEAHGTTLDLRPPNPSTPAPSTPAPGPKATAPRTTNPDGPPPGFDPGIDPSGSYRWPTPPPPPPERYYVDLHETTVVVALGDSVVIGAPADEAFGLLVEAGHRLGEVTYVDRLNGFLEVVVTFVGYPVCSVVLSLQGRGNGSTEAFCTVEALSGGEAPPGDAVATLLAHEVLHLVTPARS